MYPEEIDSWDRDHYKEHKKVPVSFEGFTVLITGGLGFIGSHAATEFHKAGFKVVLVDNLSRPSPNMRSFSSSEYNWEFFSDHFPEIIKVKGDIRDKPFLKEIFSTYHPDFVIHAAGQPSAIGSVYSPEEDFNVNVVGLFNTLELSRIYESVRGFIYLSTNKVYGDRPNTIPLVENDSRYSPKDPHFKGIDENFSIDQSKHTPYGISKLAGDLYVQEYGHLYGMDTVCFRMSCIYGDRQFGFEEQGWIAHFIINTLLNRPLTIFGNGKQVRDVLFINDLINLYLYYAYEVLIKENKALKGSQVFNIGGGPEFTLSLIETIDFISSFIGKRPALFYESWRPGDQKYYVSDIQKAYKLLGWTPLITPEEGILRCIKWTRDHFHLFK